MERFAALIRLLSRISGVFATLLIILSIIVVCQMIFQRVVLGQSTIWQTEFVTFALIAATFVGAPYVLLTRGHVNVDLVPLMLGHRARIVADVVDIWALLTGRDMPFGLKPEEGL